MTDRSKRGSEVAKAIENYFNGRKDDLGIVDVFYGDQVKVPNSPTLCIEPALTERTLNGTGNATDNSFTLNVILYDSRLGDVEGIQYELDQLAEVVADELNRLGTLDDLIIYGFSSTIEFGYLLKSNRLLRADRIIWTAKTKTEL